MKLRSITSAIYKHSPKRVQFCITQTKAFLRERIVDPLRIPKIQSEIASLVQRVAKRERYRFVFLVPISSQWKHDLLYEALSKDPSFDVDILVCPTEFPMSSEVKEKYCFTLYEMRKSGYHPIEAVRSEYSLLPIDSLGADILFYITPYDVLMPQEYRMSCTYQEALLCYSRYGYLFDTTRQWHVNKNFGFLWQIFLSSKSDELLYHKYSTFGGTNGFALGPILIDNLRKAERETPKDAPPLVIIAPHHSIEPWGYALSNFLRMADYFKTLPQKFEGRLKFAFKPHPHLKSKLYNLPSWGREKTDKYYTFWQKTPGCELQEGPYADLFARSAAMVHDCSAFCLEYQLCNKPALFIRRNHRIPKKLDEVGQLAFSLHTMADESYEIDVFLNRVAAHTIRQDLDKQKELSQKALPYGDRSVADVIVRHIKKSLKVAE
ncbi:hypothetical protein [Falsiporphyromonas endometrii]|uniref:CDP-Glycerol:Poly(Glycerophosphate) glycerophosphotransferase n=1 Tax=Falsiporphyromonas endometrii TaxID=1387297 RepID=A0ABV9K7M8_9PORP